MNKEYLRSPNKRESLKGIKNINRNKGHTQAIVDNIRVPSCKCAGMHRYEIDEIFVNSQYKEGAPITMNDGTTYVVKQNGSWVRTSRKKNE